MSYKLETGVSNLGEQRVALRFTGVAEGCSAVHFCSCLYMGNGILSLALHVLFTLFPESFGCICLLVRKLLTLLPHFKSLRD